MLSLRNQFKDYIFILNEIPGFNELSPKEAFLLGYCFNKCENKATLKEIATQIIRFQKLFEKGLLTSTQKQTVEYLLFEGVHDGLDSIIDSFVESSSKLPQNKKSSVVNIPKLEENQGNVISGIYEDLIKIGKRKKPEEIMEIIINESAMQGIDEEKDKVIEVRKVDSNIVQDFRQDENYKKLNVAAPTAEDKSRDEKIDSEILGSREEEKLTMEYIKKIQEEDEKLLELKGKEEIEKVQCLICLETIFPQQYNPLEPCGHLFHPNCTRKYIEIQITNSTFPLICPIPECNTSICPSYIQSMVDFELYNKFEQNSFKSFIEGNANEYSCCPTPDCSYIFVWIATEDSNDFICPNCKIRYCLNCRCIFHNGMTCKEYSINNKHTVRVWRENR